MEIGKKTLTLILTVTFLLGATLTYGLQTDFFLRHRSPQAHVNIWVFKETPQGIEQILGGNAITDIGEDYVAHILGWNNVTNHNATKYISLGNSTIANTKTKLDTEATSTGFERVEGTVSAKWYSSGDTAYNVTKKFTATGNIEINAAGLQWSGQGNTNDNLFALASLGGAQAFENNWNCTIVWSIVWNAND